MSQRPGFPVKLPTAGAARPARSNVPAKPFLAQASAVSARRAVPALTGLGLDSGAVRARMVSKLAEQGLKDPLVLQAMGAVERHRFVETALAGQHMRKEDTRDIVKLYNAYAVKDLKTLMPDFNWNAMLKNAGVAQEKKLVVTQVEYTKSLNNLIKNTPIDTWKTYLKWGVINGSAGLLTTALDKQNFEFYGKNLYGTESQQEDWKRAVEMVNGGLGEVVGKVYVKKHFSPEAKERMTQMVKNLLKAVFLLG